MIDIVDYEGVVVGVGLRSLGVGMGVRVRGRLLAV